jgi:hypothetical protein
VFQPGESPFLAKGTIYQGLIASADAQCPGGFDAVLGALEDDALRAFLEQKFLAASWYDLLPLVSAARTSAALVRAPFTRYVREGARMHAERDINGVHRFFLKAVPPALVADRLPRVMMLYFNFGQTEGRATGEKARVMVGRRIPEPIAEWLTAAVEGFVRAAMQLAGARSIVARLEPPKPDGATSGVPLVSSRMHLAWV